MMVQNAASENTEFIPALATNFVFLISQIIGAGKVKYN